MEGNNWINKLVKLVKKCNESCKSKLIRISSKIKLKVRIQLVYVFLKLLLLYITCLYLTSAMWIKILSNAYFVSLEVKYRGPLLNE